jgi:predicted aspartyl protease
MNKICAANPHASSEEANALKWHALYQAALFETDRRMIPARIAEAEKAILNRVRELFVVNTDHIEEDQVLDDALYALRALRNCVAPEANAA